MAHNIEEIEALATIQTIRMAGNMRIQNLILEGNTLTIMQALKFKIKGSKSFQIWIPNR